MINVLQVLKATVVIIIIITTTTASAPKIRRNKRQLKINESFVDRVSSHCIIDVCT